MQHYDVQRKLYTSDPEQFWIDKVVGFTWMRKWDRVNNFETDPTDLRWFIDGQINLSYEVLDRNVLEGRGDRVAFVHDSPVTNRVTKHTFNEILDQVSRLAGILASECGIQSGDHVSLYLPMIPETTFAMLAAVRLGAIYSFMDTVHPAKAMANRLEDFKPKVIMTTDCELAADGTLFNPRDYLHSVLHLSNWKPEKCIVLQRRTTCSDSQQQQDQQLMTSLEIDWQNGVAQAEPHGPVPVEFNAPGFVIYTSGTTGTPKGVIIPVRYIAANLAIARGSVPRGAKKTEGINDDSSLMYSGSIYNWLAGQMGACYIPLYQAHPFLLWERPIADSEMHEFYSTMVKHEVTRAFIPTSFIRTLVKQDPTGTVARSYKSKWKIDRMVVGAVAGDSSTFSWIRHNWLVNFAQLYGLTETGIITIPDLSNGRSYSDQPALSSGKSSPGVDLQVLRQDGCQADIDEVGRIVVRLPTPTIASGFLNDNTKFSNDYLNSFPGFFDTHDEGKLDADGYLYVTNRADSVYKIGGHRMSCDAIEQVLLSHPAVAECVVVTKLTADHRQLPVGFIVLNDEFKSKSVDCVIGELKDLLGEQLGDYVRLDDVVNVQCLPKSKSGKVLRKVVMDQVRNTCQP